jgi:riboflavin synthase
MFTGLVQTLATVESVKADGAGGSRLTLRAPAVAAQAVLGESISINGACLTVVGTATDTVAFECGPETLDRTNLGRLGTGSRVNLERALRVGDPLGGHYVTGHVDAVGVIDAVETSGEWRTFRFAFPKGFDDLLVVKGSVAVDGVSLTVVTAEPGKLSVMLIPHTLHETTLGHKGVGDEVNLEFDLLAKHVKKLLSHMTINL